jgi:RNA polymerase-binding transcription factor DksA
MAHATHKDLPRCSECDAPIPYERLRVLPDTTTCVKCSRVKPRTEEDVEID